MMAEFSLRNELVGWIPDDEAVNGGGLEEEIARLTNENASLREQATKSPIAPSKYNGLTFEEMRSILRQTKPACDYAKERTETLQEIANQFGDSDPNMLHL